LNLVVSEDANWELVADVASITGPRIAAGT
jgi:hypothetical protein